MDVEITPPTAPVTITPYVPTIAFIFVTYSTPLPDPLIIVSYPPTLNRIVGQNGPVKALITAPSVETEILAPSWMIGL
jgi:hypothetical protein